MRCECDCLRFEALLEMNFFLDAFLALLLCSSFVLFASPPSSHYGELQNYQLAQDFLEVTARSGRLLGVAQGFCVNGNATVLSSEYTRLLNDAGGGRCFSFECGGFAESDCSRSPVSRFCGYRFLFAGGSLERFGFCLASQQPY